MTRHGASGSGNDVLLGRDGVRDVNSCGPGSDAVSADLVDEIAADCENTLVFAVDDGPPGRAVGGRLMLLGRRRGAVELACPRGARVACRGTLTLRARGRELARAGYRVPVGRRRTLTLRLAAPLARGRRVRAATVEQGASRRGPRSSTRTLSAR